MFSETAYKIAINENFSENALLDEFTWGFNTDTSSVSYNIAKRINEGLKKLGKPWKTGIPYYKGTFFVFKNKNALCDFLYNYCELTKEDINQLSNLYKLYKLTITGITSGLSNIRGTVYDDEVKDITEVSLSSLSATYTIIPEEYCTPSETNWCIDKYYRNIVDID